MLNFLHCSTGQKLMLSGRCILSILLFPFIFIVYLVYDFIIKKNISLVFERCRRYKIPRRTPSAEALNTRRWANFALFGRNRRLSRKWYETWVWVSSLLTAHQHRKAMRLAHGYYGSLIGSHRYPIDPCRFQWPRMTLKWVRDNFFSGGSSLISLV